MIDITNGIRVIVRCDTPDCASSLWAGDTNATTEFVLGRAETAGWLVTLDRKRHYCRACAVGMSRQVGVS